MSIADAAKAAEFFLADGVIVTGGSTGQCLWIQRLYQEYLKTKVIPKNKGYIQRLKTKVLPSLCILINLDST